MSTNVASKPEWVTVLDKQIKENPKFVCESFGTG